MVFMVDVYPTSALRCLGILKVVEDTMPIAIICSPTPFLCSATVRIPGAQLLKTVCRPCRHFNLPGPSIAHAEAFAYLLPF